MGQYETEKILHKNNKKVIYGKTNEISFLSFLDSYKIIEHLKIK